MCSTQGGPELHRIVEATAFSTVCSSDASESQHARDIVLSQVVKSLTDVPAGERNPRAAVAMLLIAVWCCCCCLAGRQQV